MSWERWVNRIETQKKETPIEKCSKKSRGKTVITS